MRMDPDLPLHTPAELSDKTTAALASIQSEKRALEQRGYVALAGMAWFGSTSGAMGKVTHAAKLFCIAFACLAPNLLFIKYVL